MTNKAIDILIKKVDELEKKLKKTNDLYFKRLRIIEGTFEGMKETWEWVNKIRDDFRQIGVHILKYAVLAFLIFILYLIIKNVSASSVLEKIL